MDLLREWHLGQIAGGTHVDDVCAAVDKEYVVAAGKYAVGRAFYKLTAPHAAFYSRLRDHAGSPSSSAEIRLGEDGLVTVVYYDWGRNYGFLLRPRAAKI